MKKILKDIKNWCKKYRFCNVLINIYKSRLKTKKIINVIKSSRTEFSRNSKAEAVKYINKPGIALTFDDGYRVNHWYDYGLGGHDGHKDLFGYFDVKATFNINAFHQFEGERELNQKEIDKLLEIQGRGHEIAHHGYRHKNAVEYVENLGGEKWIKDEILPLFQWMKEKKHSVSGEGFKEPVSFVYPGSKYNNETNVLLKDYFKIFRAHMEGDNLAGFEKTGFCPSVCIDLNYFPYVSRHMKKILRHVKRSNLNLVLMCHSILPADVKWSDFNWGMDSEKHGEYRVSPICLSSIIKAARKDGLEFYTLSEIAGVASFIDKNLEERLRKLLNLPETSHKWILIKDLIQIRQLDLSDAQISNLAGIEYFINLEKLVLKNNRIQDVKLLGKLKKLSFVDIKNNPVDKKQLYEVLNKVNAIIS